MNINLAIIQGSKILKNNFIPSPMLDSEILMAKTIDKDRNYILLNSNNFLNNNDLDNFYKLIKLRLSHCLSNKCKTFLEIRIYSYK